MAGGELSVLTVLSIILIISFCIQRFLRFKKPNYRYGPIYNTFKGFIRWIYIGLASKSIQFIFSYRSGIVAYSSNNVVASSIIFVICILFPIIQALLIQYFET
jgi:hypothetical protein